MLLFSVILRHGAPAYGASRDSDHAVATVPVALQVGTTLTWAVSYGTTAR